LYEPVWALHSINLVFWVPSKHVNMRIDPFLCVNMNDRPFLWRSSLLAPAARR